MTPEPISRFIAGWGFLSNFHRAPLIWDGAEYPTSEHAFNAGKTLEPARRRWIAVAETPRIAKERGRQVPLRPGWDEVIRYQVMREVLRAKFTANTGRIEALLSTGDRELIEGNTWCDTHWGFCICRRHNCGLNWLGRMLMELREELKQ